MRRNAGVSGSIVYEVVIAVTYRLLFGMPTCLHNTTADMLMFLICGLSIGVCGDRLMRIWDLDNGDVICSCELSHRLVCCNYSADVFIFGLTFNVCFCSEDDIKKMNEDGNQDLKYVHDDSDSVVSKLALNERSNYLVGANRYIICFKILF